MDITIRDLTMRYGDTTAVDHLNLDIRSGRMLVLLGPSGCGKTTTMRCIAGLERPQGGVIKIGDRVVFDAATNISVPTHKRKVGMVFQSYAIWPHMTVAENVAFPLKMQRMPKSEIKERVEEVLEMVGLAGFGERNATKLSGGQMQRVAVARSVAMRPGVLLFDEPLSNLDAKLRDKLRFELREIQQKLQLTGVYVTHDQGEALALADEIIVMNQGRIEQRDEPVKLYESPTSPFVADFLGVDNIFKGVVGGDGVIELGGGLRVSIEHGVAEGVGVDVWFRADHVEIGQREAAAANVWEGRVVAHSFLGTSVRYHIVAGASDIDLYAISDAQDAVFPPGASISVKPRLSRVQVMAS